MNKVLVQDLENSCHVVIPVSLECLRGIACFDMGGSKLLLSHVQYTASLGLLQSITHSICNRHM